MKLLKTVIIILEKTCQTTTCCKGKVSKNQMIYNNREKSNSLYISDHNMHANKRNTQYINSVVLCYWKKHHHQSKSHLHYLLPVQVRDYLHHVLEHLLIVWWQAVAVITVVFLEDFLDLGV